MRIATGFALAMTFFFDMVVYRQSDRPGEIRGGFCDRNYQSILLAVEIMPMTLVQEKWLPS